MGDVIQSGIITTLNTDPSRALQTALDIGMSAVIIIGRDKDGEFYFASSQADSGEVVWFLQRAQWELFKMEDAISEDGDPRGKPRRGA